MKKFSMIFAIILVVSMITTTVFADDTVTVAPEFSGTEILYTSGSVNLEFKPNISATATNTTVKVTISNSATNWDVTDISSDHGLDVAGVNSKGVITFAKMNTTLTLDPSKVLASFTMTPKAGKTTEALNDTITVEVKIKNGSTYLTNSKTIYTIKLGPVVSNQELTFDKNTYGNYTDVPCYNGSASISGTYTNVKLGFDLYDGANLHKTISPVAISTSDGTMTIENATIKFKVAVIGAPEDADVQIKNIVVNAE